MYAILSYGDLVADRLRSGAYREALRQIVGPGSVVLDVGTGSGILALFACQVGARRVYAIDPNDVIHLARDIAAANGYLDRIEFIQALSWEVTLPEPVDVIVSDLRGVLPLRRGLVRSIADARRRFLSPGGVLIPQRDTLWAAVVEAPELYRRHVEPWRAQPFDLDMESALLIATSTWSRGRVTPEQLLAAPQLWATLDYAAIESPNVVGQASCTPARAGTAHGLCVWFDTVLGEGVSLSNAPGAPELVYGSAFFPWTRPVEVAPGDGIRLELGAHWVEAEYLWHWNAQVLRDGDPRQVEAEFRQTTFFGRYLSLERLRRGTAGYSPKLSEEGLVDCRILEAMDGRTTLREIAQRVAGQFPQRFAGWQQALPHVHTLSEKYGH